MDRRNFILNSGKSLIALTVFGSGTYSFASTAAENALNCLPTTADILGPFYRANAPIRSNLVVPGDPGSPLLFKGRVFDHLCNPIEGATVDVWHADDSGDYDNTTQAFDYRGKNITPADGSYSFTSVEPGWYLNGSQFRPRHIHFRVTAPGHTELITQLYFVDDPYIANDPWASDPDAELRIVPIDATAATPTAVFDIYLLNNNPTGLNEILKNQQVQLSQNPVHSEAGFTSSSPILAMEVFNSQGQLVARQYDINRHELQVNVAHLATGVYYSRVQTEKGIEVVKLVKE